MLEDAVINSSRRRHTTRESNKRFRCTGGHKDLAGPTTLKRGYRPINQETRTNNRNKEQAWPSSSSSVVPDSASTTSISTSRQRRLAIAVKNKALEKEVVHGMIGDNSAAAGASLSFDINREEDGTIARSNACTTNTNHFVTPAGAKNASFYGEPSRQLFVNDTDSDLQGIATYSTITAGTPGSSTAIHGLHVEASILRQHVIELKDRNVQLQNLVLSLTKEIEALSSTRTTTTREEEQTAFETEEDANQQERVLLVGLVGESTVRHRVSSKNAELSDNLSILIGNFITKGELADRRKFPESRLAKILVDSVAAFEWTHCEISKFAIKQQRKVADSTTGFSETVQLTSELLAVLGRKRKQGGRHRGDRSKALLLVQCIWDGGFLHGEARAVMIDQVRQYLRRHVFSPWKILKAMDIAGFKLSLAGIEVLRNVEVASRYGRASLPSKSTILRCARRLEAAASEFCPFKMIGRTFQEDYSEDEQGLSAGDGSSIVGEGFEFDTIKVTETLFKAFGLMDEAKHRSVELGLASDGAQLTNTISHVAAGLKFNDVAMKDPTTKKPMLLHSPDSLVQSRNLCFPLRIVIAKDNKMTLEGFRSLYKSFNSGDIAEAFGCRPFKMSFPGDMKAQWGALDEGGAAKVKDKFCYICPCQSSCIHIPQDKTQCILCTNRAAAAGTGGVRDMEDEDDDVAKECYHYQFFADPGVRATLNEELDVLSTIITEDNQGLAASSTDKGRMYVRRPGEVMVEGDLLDVDCRPSSTRDKAAMAALVTAELARRLMPTSGLLQERKERLKDILLKEQRARDLSKMLTESQPKERAMYLVLQAVVCILHLENRVGLKSIESILRSGLSNAQKGILDWTTASGIQARQEQYVKRISRIISCNILGTSIAPAQWRFPLGEDGLMGTLSMDNNRTRRVMNSIELLVNVSFPCNDINRKRLLRCFPKYRAAMVLLRKNSDLDDNEIQTFQSLIDAWFNDWVRVYGKEGCTNYTHMLSSSHVMR